MTDNHPKKEHSGVELANLDPGDSRPDLPKDALGIEDMFNNDQKEQEKNVQVKVGCLKRCRTKCCSKEPVPGKKIPSFESNPNLRVKNIIKRIVNGRFVLTLMTLVTLFALIGVSFMRPLPLKFELSRY